MKCSLSGNRSWVNNSRNCSTWIKRLFPLDEHLVQDHKIGFQYSMFNFNHFWSDEGQNQFSSISTFAARCNWLSSIEFFFSSILLFPFIEIGHDFIRSSCFPFAFWLKTYKTKISPFSQVSLTVCTAVCKYRLRMARKGFHKATLCSYWTADDILARQKQFFSSSQRSFDKKDNQKKTNEVLLHSTRGQCIWLHSFIKPQTNSRWNSCLFTVT